MCVYIFDPFLDSEVYIKNDFKVKCKKKFKIFTESNNSYLSHRIIDNFPWISKGKIIRLKPV